MRQELSEALRPEPPLPKPTAEAKSQERWAEGNTPSEAVYAAAADHTERAHRRYEKDTAEDRRNRQYHKEVAQWNREGEDPRVRYQREIDRWWQAKKDFEAALLENEYVMIGGFREPRYRTTCHRGRGDPDYGL
jgi:hypothetical protein